jgi:spermidine synthase
MIVQARSSHHTIELFCHCDLGKVLVLDGEIQHVEAWAPFYHESLVHLPMVFLAKPKRVLILGGGSLFTAMEVLRYPSVERVVMLDHDKVLINLLSEHYPHVPQTIADRRLEIRHVDAPSAIGQLEMRFDLIINDAFDLLLTKRTSLFQELASKLTPEGVCADLIYRHLFERKAVRATLKILRRRFRFAAGLVAVPEYPGVLHLLTIWSATSRVVTQKVRSSRNVEHIRWQRKPANNPCAYFDPRFISYYFYLPPYLRRLLIP